MGDTACTLRDYKAKYDPQSLLTVKKNQTMKQALEEIRLSISINQRKDKATSSADLPTLSM